MQGFTRHHNCSRTPGEITHVAALKDQHDEDAAIEATAQAIAAAVREHVRRAQQRAESEAKVALAAGETERKALAAQLVDLQRKLKEATAARTVAETQYQQLAAASEQLAQGLSRTLHEQRAQSRPAPSPGGAKKKPLQFSGPARDAKRVRMRQGTYVSVDGIPGELVDLSLGGAQVVLTQMVKPNQIVRATIPTAKERITCRGRIVWVLYEQPETSLSVYRAGVKFTDVDTKAVEDFMKDFCESSQAQHSAGIA
jgi:PilZ domain